MTTQHRLVKENLTEVSEQKFNELLAAYQTAKPAGFSGPFIHSAPKGNMFSGPFKEEAWTIGTETVLQKSWLPADGWKFFGK